MQRVTFVRPGLLEWWEVPEPKLENPSDAIVRPIAATTCDVDLYTTQGRTPFSQAGPYPFGHEFVIAFFAEQKGAGVTGGLDCLALAPEAAMGSTSAQFTVNVMYVTGRVTGAAVQGGTAT